MIKECIRLIIESGVYPESSTREIVDLIVYANSKGYLHCAKRGDEVVACGICYRVKSSDDIHKVPEEEEGDILFISCFTSRDRKAPLRLLRHVLKKYSGIKEVLWHRIGDSDGREKETRFTASTAVLSRS